MAATLTTSMVDCAPGNALTLGGKGLTGGASASVVLQNQGILAPVSLTIAGATFATDGSGVTFTVPDGVTSGTLVVTANDLSTANCFLNVASQYLQSAQYASDGEGTDAQVAALPTGVLDNVLRDASGFVDEVVGTTLRYLQVQEDHRFRRSRRVYPFRGPGRKIPLVSLDALSFITSNAITTNFNVTGSAPDVYVNKTLGYFEVQTYAVGNAILLGAIQTIGFSADVWRATYTAGFPWQQTPQAIRKATAIIATELLVYRDLITSGIGGLSRAKKGLVQYDRRNEPFSVPAPALDLLKAYATGSPW